MYHTLLFINKILITWLINAIFQHAISSSAHQTNVHKILCFPLIPISNYLSFILYMPIKNQNNLVQKSNTTMLSNQHFLQIDFL